MKLALVIAYLWTVILFCKAVESFKKTLEDRMKNKQVLSHKQKRAAKRLFPRKKHSTRSLSSEDYKNIPAGETVAEN